MTLTIGGKVWCQHPR